VDYSCLLQRSVVHMQMRFLVGESADPLLWKSGVSWSPDHFPSLPFLFCKMGVLRDCIVGSPQDGMKYEIVHKKHIMQSRSWLCFLLS
jgi:hypothetical protein